MIRIIAILTAIPTLVLNRCRGDSACDFTYALRFQIVRFHCDFKLLRLRFCEWSSELRPLQQASFLWVSTTLFGKSMSVRSSKPAKTSTQPRTPKENRNNSTPNMTGRPGCRTMEMIGGSSVSYLARTPCVPLSSTLFNRAGNRRAFRQGRAGIIFPLYTVEPSPSHIECRTTHTNRALCACSVSTKQGQTQVPILLGEMPHGRTLSQRFSGPVSPDTAILSLRYPISRDTF